MIKETQIIEQEYLQNLHRIKDTIRQNQNKAMTVVNSAMIITYYEIGTIINEKKVWGNKYIERLSKDLSEYGGGYSKSNLKYMSKFSNTFSYEEISQRGVGQIAWRSIIVIMSKCKTQKERLWYVSTCHKNGWGRDMLLNQISMKAYERSLIEPTATEIINASSEEIIKELFKDTYVFDFFHKVELKMKNNKITYKNLFVQFEQTSPFFILFITFFEHFLRK